MAKVKRFHLCKPIELMSLFNGFGGARIALDNLGVKVSKYYSSEIDKFASKVSAVIHPDIIDLGDINEHESWEKADIDILVAGFPCQAYSMAGKRKGFEDPRGVLIFRMFEVICDYQPKMFLLENVKGLLSHQKGGTIKLILEELRSCGYVVDYQITNSALVSTQNRQRVFFVGLREDLYNEQKLLPPQPRDRGIVISDILEDGVAFTKNLGKYKIHNQKTTAQKDNLIITRCLKVGEAIDIKGQEHQKRVYSPKGKAPTLTTMGGGNRHIKVAIDDLFILQSARGFNKGGLFYGKSPSLTSKSWVHNNTLVAGSDDTFFYRKLTPKECGRLQTVPDAILDKMLSSGTSNTQLYKMLGNGFTIKVVEHYLKYMISYLGAL